MGKFTEALARFEAFANQGVIQMTVEDFEKVHPATAYQLAVIVNKFMDDVACVLETDLGIKLKEGNKNGN